MLQGFKGGGGGGEGGREITSEVEVWQFDIPGQADATHPVQTVPVNCILLHSFFTCIF